MTRIAFFTATATFILAGFGGSWTLAAEPGLRDEALALFEPIPQSPDPTPDPAAVALGKALFFEPRLSEGHNISCNTCHNLGTGGVDLAPVSLGHRWQKGGRNSPTVLNATYNTAQFWDGRAADLTEQAGGPMVNPVEMGSTQEHVVEQLKGIPGYLPLFAAAFPADPDPVNFPNAEAAIAAFEQTLITPNAPFDRFLRGDDAAMTAEQQAGLRAFIDQGCAACHNGVNLGGNSYQPFGVVEKPDWAIMPPGDKGRFEVTRAEEDAYVFKVPTLRNIAVTPPYFHSGSVWDLNLAVGVMGSAQLGAALDPDQEASIVADSARNQRNGRDGGKQMNLSLMSLELSVVALGILVLLADLWLPAERKRALGYAAAAALGLLFLNTFTSHCSCAATGEAFGGMFVQDALSVFFKRFFLLAAVLVLILAVEFADRIAAGISEYYSLIVFALAGMLFAASSNDFAMLFVSIELITITFYVLTSFTRGKVAALEAGVKYLILGALSSAFMIYGIALVWGTTGKFNFNELAMVSANFVENKLFLFGVLFILVGLGFKIAAFPFQMWTPDVYQGAPTPTTAFLAVGSKAAGFVLLLRFLFTAIPSVTAHWDKLLIIVSGVTILYGNLCAIPQRNLKRLLGYSSIAHAGYLLLGVAALTGAGQAAVLYYLSGYLFTTLAAFAVIAIVLRHLDSEDISGLAGLHQRSPLLAATLTLAMVSLAGIPPLAGFFGKFLLLKAVIEQGATNHGYYCLAFTALVGVVISLYYYFGVIKAIYFGKVANDTTPIPMSLPMRAAICLCIGGMFWLGLVPSRLLNAAEQAIAVLK